MLAPLKLVIENYPEDAEEWLDAANHPNRPELGVRKVPFSREILIERDDFMEDPPRKFYRLKPGGEVRLRYAYIIKCERVVKDDNGEIIEIRCGYDPATRSGSTSQPGRKVKGTIHWVSKRHAVAAEVRLYDRLFTAPYPGSSADLGAELNTRSLETLGEAMLEPSLADAKAGERFQFERQGYFFVEDDRAGEARPVFNRTVTLRDSWAKIERQVLAGQPGG